VDAGVDESHGPPERRSRIARAGRATASFFAGFAIQIVSLTGRLMSDDAARNRWFARGEWAAYGFVALVAALALALLVTQL